MKKRFAKVYLEITNICNLSCDLCPGNTRPPHSVTPEEFRALADKLRPYTDYLYFHVMGEPLLHPQLETLFEKYEITASELAQVRLLEEKLNKQEMTVSVIGQFKRGKSTLVNGILGEKVMPVGIVPVTAVVTTVKYGERGARVHFENGAVIDTSFEGISQYINEQENHDNHLGVSKVELFVPADFLKTGITLVDTPGVGSVHQKNTEAATAFVKESDAVIFLLSSF